MSTPTDDNILEFIENLKKIKDVSRQLELIKNAIQATLKLNDVSAIRIKHLWDHVTRLKDGKSRSQVVRWENTDLYKSIPKHQLEAKCKEGDSIIRIRRAKKRLRSIWQEDDQHKILPG